MLKINELHLINSDLKLTSIGIQHRAGCSLLKAFLEDTVAMSLKQAAEVTRNMHEITGFARM